MGHSYEKIGNRTGLIKVGRELSSGRRSAISELKELCGRAEDGGVVNMILDFSEVRVCPSIVLGSIIVLAKRLGEKEGRVRIACPSPHVARAAQITGLTKAVEICGSVEDAVKDIEKE